MTRYRFYFFVILFFCVLSGSYVFAQSEDIEGTLPEILSDVYRSNPTLIAAREQLEGTHAILRQAQAGWLPVLTAQASITATDVSSNNFSSGDGATTKDYGVNIDQPIWRGGQTFAQTARAHELIRAARAGLKQVEQDVYLDVISAYMNVLRDRELLDLRTRNEGNLEQEEQGARERKRLGDLTETDVQQAKARAARAKSARIQAASDLAGSEAEFEQIVGYLPALRLETPQLGFSLPEALEDMAALAEQQNAELWISIFQEKAAKHGADAVLRELLPQITAFASYNRQLDPQPGIIDEASVEAIGVRANLVLYEGGAIRARADEARHDVKRLGYESDEVRRRIRQNVISQWHAYNASQNITAVQKQEVESARLALKGVQEEARLGQRSVINVLDADEDLINAQVSLVRAQRNEVFAKVQMAATLALLDFAVF